MVTYIVNLPQNELYQYGPEINHYRKSSTNYLTIARIDQRQLLIAYSKKLFVVDQKYCIEAVNPKKY